MKRFALLLLLIISLCAATFFTASKPFVSPGPQAVDGVLDFSETDFSSRVYDLDGEWEFYFDRLYTPADFAGGAPEGRELLHLPDSWAGLGYPDTGHGTFRLTVRTPSERHLLLFIPEIIEASRLWVNGEELFHAGAVGGSPDTSDGSIRNELLTVFPKDGVLELVVQASNYHLIGSGLSYSVLIGRDTVLTHHIFWQRMVVSFVLGGIFFIGLYHLFLFGFRRREKLYLIFSATCMVVVLRLAMESNNLFQYFLPGGSGQVLVRLFLLLFTLHALCVSLFLLRTFSIRLNRVLGAVYLTSFLLPALAVLSLSYLAAFYLSFLVLIPCAISLVMAFRTDGKWRDPYHLLYLCGMVFYIINGPLSKTLLEGKLFVPGIVSNLFLILCQCVMLSRSYAQARAEVERVNANLEGLVRQRTGQLHAANERLAASQTALREMISNISHDLKTPLTVLNNYLELLGDENVAVGEQERAEYLNIAYRKNIDLQRLIHNLFEVTRLEGGTAVYRMEWVPAGRLAREAEQKYADLARDQGITFSARAEDGLELHIDGDKIWSVLDNLVYNALRHTPAGGCVTLTLRRAGDRAELIVSDTGEGIGPEHLPHLFERFYKASAERGEKDGSSGLGLYIVKTSVEAMGGTAAVESAPGKGAVFTVTFAAKQTEK